MAWDGSRDNMGLELELPSEGMNEGEKAVWRERSKKGPRRECIHENMEHEPHIPPCPWVLRDLSCASHSFSKAT